MFALSRMFCCCSSNEVIGLCVAFAGIVYGFVLTSVLFSAALFDAFYGPIIMTCLFVMIYTTAGFRFIAGVPMKEFAALEPFRRYSNYVLRYHLCASIPMILIGIIDLTEDIVGIYMLDISLITLGFSFLLISIYCFFVIESIYKKVSSQYYEKFLEKQKEDIESNVIE